MENEPFDPNLPQPSSDPAPPIMPYQNYALMPHRSFDAVLAFGLSICVIPGTVISALYFNIDAGFILLCIGSTFTLSMALAARKEIRESNGHINGLPFAVLAIWFSLAGPVVLFIVWVLVVGLPEVLTRF